MAIVEQQTWSLDLADAFFNALSTDPYFAGYTCRESQMLPVQTNLIPYLGVYLLDENHGPDGDANAGMIRFIHTARFGISVVQANNDARALRRSIDNAFLHIMSRLWTDAGISNVWKGAKSFHAGKSRTRNVRGDRPRKSHLQLAAARRQRNADLRAAVQHQRRLSHRMVA